MLARGFAGQYHEDREDTFDCSARRGDEKPLHNDGEWALCVSSLTRHQRH